MLQSAELPLDTRALPVTRDDDGTTTVTGSVADQAQLQGVLAGLRDIGAVLLGLSRCGGDDPR